MKELVSILLLLLAADALSQPAAGYPPAEIAPVDVPEILVSTSEPRYVAPTRRDRIGRIWAPVYLNGKGPFRLVLDTGANRSVVIQRVADILGDDARTERTARVRGVTGTSVVPLIRVDRMVVGDLLMEPVFLPVVEDVFGGAEGVLGNEGLRDKRIVINFKRDFISVKRSRRERPAADFQTSHISMMRDYLLVVDVLIGRVPTKAIIDTGAPDSIGNLALLAALKKQPKEDGDTDIIGVTLDIERGSRVPMPVIRMTGVNIRGAVLTFGDVQIFKHWQMTRQPAVMLGMDVLGVVDELIIDYLTRELHVRPGRP